MNLNECRTRAEANAPRHVHRMIRQAAAVLMLAASLTGCAQVGEPSAASARYQGTFVAFCSEMMTGFYAADALVLKPIDSTKVEAQYVKTFFTDPTCARSSRLLRVTLPAAQWDLQSTVAIGGKNVDKVVVTLRDGLLEGQILQPEVVKETPEAFVITFKDDKGGAASVPLQKATAGSVKKELRLIEGDRLYVGDEEGDKADDGFPAALLDGFYFQKQ